MLYQKFFANMIEKDISAKEAWLKSALLKEL